jgi:hypothetical protein
MVTWLPPKAGNDPKVTDREANQFNSQMLISNIAFEKVVFEHRTNIANKTTDRLGLVHCFHTIWE